ncbi:MAG: arginyltransferase [Pirellula sp.]|jgi:arginine-tRNA-protein transferase
MQELTEHRTPTSLPILTVIDNEHPCSYLPSRTARMPLVVPERLISGEEFDVMLAGGMRRSGRFAYYTACEGCQACEPVRIDVTKFRWTDSWRRVLNRGDRMLRIEVGPPEFSEERLKLFNLHRGLRDLSNGDGDYAAYDYEGFLVDSCCLLTREIRFYLQDSLVAVSVIDVGHRSISAVYTYFDPAHSKLSLGSYSVLKQIEMAQINDLPWVYLGLYVQANSHLNYKSRFKPQQRYINSKWVDFE